MTTKETNKTVEAIQNIADNLFNHSVDGSIDAHVSYDVDTHNMISYGLQEIGEQLKRIADHLEKK